MYSYEIDDLLYLSGTHLKQKTNARPRQPDMHRISTGSQVSDILEPVQPCHNLIHLLPRDNRTAAECRSPSLRLADRLCLLCRGERVRDRSIDATSKSAIAT